MTLLLLIYLIDYNLTKVKSFDYKSALYLIALYSLFKKKIFNQSNSIITLG